MVIFSSICFNFNILLPLLAKDTLDAGPRTFGIISACSGAGALIGALLRGGDRRGTLARDVHRRGRLRPDRLADRARALDSSRRGRAAVRLRRVLHDYSANVEHDDPAAKPGLLRGRVLGLYYYAWNGFAPLGALIVG